MSMPEPSTFPDPLIDLPADSPEPVAVLGGGCFWCVEAVYQQLDGVLEVVSGYAGGSASTANYEAVCTGTTGHAEVVQVRYDPARISFGQILKVFFSVAHDPTQLNRQGPDRGTQYRSVIFYANEQERAVAAAYIDQLNQARLFDQPIVTTLEPLVQFFPAERYHQNYARTYPDQPYVAYYALPKAAKARKYFRTPETMP